MAETLIDSPPPRYSGGAGWGCFLLEFFSITTHQKVMYILFALRMIN